MRRTDREITDLNIIKGILDDSKVIRITMFDDEYPYIVPLCFGYEITGNGMDIYLHCAKEGMKLDLIKKNNHVSFEVDDFVRTQIMHYGITARYRSVIGSGDATILDSDEDKRHGLQLILNQYGYQDYDLSNCKTFDFTTVIRIHVKEFHGKKNVE